MDLTQRPRRRSTHHSGGSVTSGASAQHMKGFVRLMSGARKERAGMDLNLQVPPESPQRWESSQRPACGVSNVATSLRVDRTPPWRSAVEGKTFFFFFFLTQLLLTDTYKRRIIIIPAFCWCFFFFFIPSSSVSPEWPHGAGDFHFVLSGVTTINIFHCWQEKKKRTKNEILVLVLKYFAENIHKFDLGWRAVHVQKGKHVARGWQDKKK